MGTLYECLKEARLEKYYPSFRAQGITKSEALTRLTVHDCPTFGINSAEDKRRLLELISIIKAVHNSERESYQSGGGHKQIQNVKNKAARKRNRSPALTPTQVAGRALSSAGDVRVQNRSRTNASSHQLSAAGAALLDLISDEDTSETSSDDSGEHSDYEPAVKHSVTASVSREVPTRVKKTPVEKVKHGAGYNYGVPGGGGNGAARPKSRGNSRVNDEKIRVCVRKRPLSKKEIKSGEDDLARAVSTNTLVISEPKQAVDLTAFTLQHEFIFDEVFEESCSNEDVYIRAARPLINCLFDGGSATCFAYGQTGAGKTHTMIGNHDVPGLYLLAAHDIFNLIDSGQYGSGIHVWVSFFEIYCGQLFDLLNKRTSCWQPKRRRREEAVEEVKPSTRNQDHYPSLTVNSKNRMPFPGDDMKQQGLEILRQKKKQKTLECFVADYEWAVRCIAGDGSSDEGVQSDSSESEQQRDNDHGNIDTNFDNQGEAATFSDNEDVLSNLCKSQQQPDNDHGNIDTNVDDQGESDTFSDNEDVRSNLCKSQKQCDNDHGNIDTNFDNQGEAATFSDNEDVLSNLCKSQQQPDNDHGNIDTNVDDQGESDTFSDNEDARSNLCESQQERDDDHGNIDTNFDDQGESDTFSDNEDARSNLCESQKQRDNDHGNIDTNFDDQGESDTFSDNEDARSNLCESQKQRDNDHGNIDTNFDDQGESDTFSDNEDARSNLCESQKQRDNDHGNIDTNFDDQGESDTFSDNEDARSNLCKIQQQPDNDHGNIDTNVDDQGESDTFSDNEDVLSNLCKSQKQRDNDHGNIDTNFDDQGESDTFSDNEDVRSNLCKSQKQRDNDHGNIDTNFDDQGESDTFSDNEDVRSNLSHSQQENVNDHGNIDTNWDDQGKSDPSESQQLFDIPSLQRDINQPGIYIRKLTKSCKSSKAQASVKKVGNNRVYDNYHSCLFCGEMRQHIKLHLETHKHITEVKQLLANENPDIVRIRKLGDHKHNKKVIKHGKGQIILSRRPETDLDITRYGPCIICKEWVLLKNLKRHVTKCSGRRITVSKRHLIIQSQVEAGLISKSPSKLMLKEVFPCMRMDDIGQLAKSDTLIIALGESWLRRSIDNREKRKYYASQHMRLMAKLLIQIRKLDTSSANKELAEYLVPQHFDLIVAAALECCVPFMDDVEELQSPSNGIKIKYDLQRVLTARWAMLVKEDPHSVLAKEVQTCQELMKIEWADKIVKLSRTVLARRSLGMRKELPAPEDILKLTQFITEELKTTALSAENYTKIVKLAQTRLLVYNKRRSGELEAIRLENYAGKTRDIDEMDQSLIDDLTKVELHLLKSQELMQVRGKGNRPVPVLIPADAIKPLDYIASRTARREAGIPESNVYLFPNSGQSHARAYSSLKCLCDQCLLTYPGRITSVSMRKYTATLTQMLNLNPNQIDWVCKHLGHSSDVHKAHYRQMSGLIERVYVTKLLLLQDLNLTKKFKGQSLDEIDISDIVFPDGASIDRDFPDGASIDRNGTDTLLDNVVEDVAQTERDDEPVDRVVFEDSEDDGEDEDEFEDEAPPPKKIQKKVVRQRWDETEMKEIHEYFKLYLDSKITPRSHEVNSAKKKITTAGNHVTWMDSVIEQMVANSLKSDPKSRLHPREDGSHRVCIAGLTETEARDVSSLMQVLDYGNSVRSKGVSGVNPDSSRSHAVLQMEVRDQQDKRLGRISFIDLAGSERASDSGEPDRQTRMEGAEINQSLLALKECIRSIDQSSRHKPFRQSKLTHILKDSFMGNSRTCMIANISPGSSSCEHTLNTLRYADRVKELRRNSGSVNRSMNVAMSNILMNIPASAPSLFQPSNILCSSTPMRKQGSRPFTNRDSSDLQLDPSETPVRGPGVRRKTSSAASRNDLRSGQSSTRASSSSNRSGQNVRGSVSSSVSSKSAVVRHVASNVSSGTKQNLSSNSESDQTDTDSNNVTGPQKPTILSNQLQNIAVKSVNDFKTFGNNKSNNNSAVGASVQNIPVVKSTDTENDFPTTDFNNEEEMNDLNRSNKNPVAASVPVFALAKQSEAQSRIQNGRPERAHLNEVSSVSASVPVLRKKMYTENQSESDKQEAVSDMAENDFGQQGGSRPQQFAFNQDAVKVASDSQNGGAGVRHSPVNFKRRDLDKPTSVEAPKRSELRLPSVFTESFEDDLLFDAGSMEQRLWTPRTPSESSGTQPRIPQDPALEPEIPAVLPAKSSDLTTFSQRSPRWHLNKNRNQNNFPGQPAQKQKGFRPEPVQNVPNIPAQNKDNMSNLQPSNMTGGTSTAVGNAYQNQSKHKNIGNEPNDIGHRNKSANIIPKQRENNMSPQVGLKQEPLTDGFNKISINSRGGIQSKADYGGKAGSKTELKEPLSANWFSTPADHDTHITASVNKRRSTSGEQSEKDKDSLKTKSETKLLQLCEFDQTDLKELEEDYLPLQRDKSRSPTSDSGVVCTASERTTPNTSKTNITNEHGRKTGENSSKSDYRTSHFSQAGYFSDSVTNQRSGQTTQSGVKHRRVVHSPVNVRQTQNTSPVIKDIPSTTPVNSQSTSQYGNKEFGSYSPVGGRAGNSVSPSMGKGGNTAVKTEKIQTGAIFSPIHPQPVTGGRQLAKSTAVVSKDILHPTPFSKVSASVDSRSQSTGGDDEFVDLKSQLIAAHEDQLASVTSLCKQEMKLLLGAKAGNKSFEEYMKKVGDVLSQKMSTIQILQDQIIAYQLSTQD